LKVAQKTIVSIVTFGQSKGEVYDKKVAEKVDTFLRVKITSLDMVRQNLIRCLPVMLLEK
jgi:hypothetical protein